MKIKNYDITKLTIDEKSDFEKIFNSIDNYINQKYNYYEYIDKLRKLDIHDWLIAHNHVCHIRGCDIRGCDIHGCNIRGCDNKYLRFLDEQLYNLKDESRNNYLNIYKKYHIKIYQMMMNFLMK